MGFLSCTKQIKMKANEQDSTDLVTDFGIQAIQKSLKKLDITKCKTSQKQVIWL